jgi:hypothetical protein
VITLYKILMTSSCLLIVSVYRIIMPRSTCAVLCIQQGMLLILHCFRSTFMGSLSCGHLETNGRLWLHTSTSAKEPQAVARLLRSVHSLFLSRPFLCHHVAGAHTVPLPVLTRWHCQSLVVSLCMCACVALDSMPPTEFGALRLLRTCSVLTFPQIDGGCGGLVSMYLTVLLCSGRKVEVV